MGEPYPPCRNYVCKISGTGRDGDLRLINNGAEYGLNSRGVHQFVPITLSFLTSVRRIMFFNVEY